MNKEQRQFYLGRGMIHFIINWKSGLNCFGQARTEFKY
jgi:hypothetical protein